MGVEDRVSACENKINFLLAQQMRDAIKLAAALQASRNIEPSIPGAGVAGGGGLTALSLFTIARVTTAITAVSGTTAGTGIVTFQSFDGAVYSDTAVTGVSVYNYHDKIHAINARIFTVKPIDGYWQVIDVDKCANLS